MANIAFLGDAASLPLFRQTGATLFTPEGEGEVARILRTLRAEQYAIVFVTEAIYEQAKRTIDALDGTLLPAVIVVPGHHERGGVGGRRLDTLMENAMGLKL